MLGFIGPLLIAAGLLAEMRKKISPSDSISKNRFDRIIKIISDYGPTIIKYATQYGIPDWKLIIAFIEQESGGNPNAKRAETKPIGKSWYDRNIKSDTGWYKFPANIRSVAEPYRWQPERIAASYGLMQIMYTTAIGEGYTGIPEGLFNPEVNLMYGIKHLSSLLKKYDSLKKAMIVYNAGPLGLKEGTKAHTLGTKYANSVMALHNLVKQVTV